MKQMYLKGYKEIVPQQVKRPVPSKGEVLVRVSKVGVCGSDISAFYGKHPYIPFQIVLGHEFSGYIEEIGPDTQSPSVGTRVTVLPHRPCMHCEACADGHYNWCEKLVVIGCQCDGAQAEYVLSPASMIFSLPDEISMTDAALIEPMAVAYHGAKKAVKKGDHVLILGAGGIGLFTMQSANLLGAVSTTIADYSSQRLELAKHLGATNTIDLSKETLADRMAHLPVNQKINVFCDCVGANGAALDSIIQVAKRGSRVICIGVIASDYQAPHLPDLTEHELTFYGSNMFVPQDFSDVIENLAAKRLKTDGIYTHKFSLDRVPEMYCMIDEKKEAFIKLLIEVE